MWFANLRDRSKRFVDAGRVHCPQRAADIDVELCYACPRLVEFAVDTSRPYISCPAARQDGD